MTDNDLLGLFSSSPQKAYPKIIEQYGSLVYAIAANKLHLCASSEDIEDCVSDIFVEVFRGLEKFSPEKGALKTFISTIARNIAVSTYRRLSYRQSITDNLDDESLQVPSADDVEAEAVDKVFGRQLLEAIMSLGEPDSSIIIHQYYYNHTIRETAEMLSMTVGAVQQRSLRARKRIEKLLTEEG